MAARIRDSKPDSHVFEIEPGLLDPRDVVEALEDALPHEWEMVNSGGHCSWFFAQMPSRPQEKFLTIREFGAIGNGISFAMGVAAARPDRTVVLFDGDGSLMMHVQELETIKRHRLNILIVVMNDGAYGSEVHKLRSEGMPEDGSVFGYCDFAGIARGFGLAGKDLQESGRSAEARGGVRRKRRRRGLGLSRLGQGRVADHTPRPSSSCQEIAAEPLGRGSPHTGMFGGKGPDVGELGDLPLGGRVAV